MLLVRIDTDAGVYGLGEAGNFFGDRQAIAYAREWLIGRDPLAIRPFVRAMLSGGLPPYEPQMSPTATVDGPAAWAVSGVEMALCDLAGKILGTPVYNLLGGAFRDRIRVYLDRSGVADPSDLGRMAGARRAGHRRRLPRLQVRRRVDRARGEPRSVEPPDADRPGAADLRAPGGRPRGRRARRRDRPRRPLQLRRRDRHPPGQGARAARSQVVRGSGPDPQLRRAEARPRREPDPDLRRRDAGAPTSSAR